MGRKEIQTTRFSEFPLHQSFDVHVWWYPLGAEGWLKTRPWSWSSILPLVKGEKTSLVKFCIKNSDVNMLLSQIQHMPCVTITRVFSGLCKVQRQSIPEILLNVLVLWLEYSPAYSLFSDDMSLLGIVLIWDLQIAVQEIASDSLNKKMWVPHKGLKRKESFLACTHCRFPFLYYSLAATLKDRIFASSP